MYWNIGYRKAAGAMLAFALAVSGVSALADETAPDQAMQLACAGAAELSEEQKHIAHGRNLDDGRIQEIFESFWDGNEIDGRTLKQSLDSARQQAAGLDVSVILEDITKEDGLRDIQADLDNIRAHVDNLDMAALALSEGFTMVDLMTLEGKIDSETLDYTFALSTAPDSWRETSDSIRDLFRWLDSEARQALETKHNFPEGWNLRGGCSGGSAISFPKAIA